MSSHTNSDIASAMRFGSAVLGIPEGIPLSHSDNEPLTQKWSTELTSMDFIKLLSQFGIPYDDLYKESSGTVRLTWKRPSVFNSYHRLTVSIADGQFWVSETTMTGDNSGSYSSIPVPSQGEAARRVAKFLGVGTKNLGGKE